MDETILNWGDGTQGAFNQCSIPKKCAAPPGWGRQTSAAPGFGRAQDPSMNRALVDPGLAEKQRFTHMSNTDKLGVAIRHAALRLPAEARDQAMALVDPANLAIMAGALAVWVGAQATPVGWVVNIAMIGVGVAATGAVAVQVARELRDFALGVLSADDTADLRVAGDHLAKAVVLVGVDLVVALLLKKAIVKVRQPKMPKLESGETKLLFGKYDPRAAQRSLPPERMPSNATATVTPNGAPKKASNHQGSLSAAEANAPHVAKGNLPPYADGTRARDIVLQKDRVFARVHGEGNQARSWMMRAEDIDGLTPQQIKDKFALPELPSFVSDVHVPAGSQIRVGTVAPQPGWGGGGGTQYELLQRLSSDAFKNMRPLP
jgi:hypothetical protein